MLAAAHTKGGFGGVSQKVGREFVNADEAVGRLKRKDRPMAKKMGNKVMAGGEGMSPRKALAGGTDSGNFGVQSYESMHGPAAAHPDRAAGTNRKGAMADGERGIGASIQHTKGHHPAQAAPDHGSTHPGGHGNHGQYEDRA